MTTQSLNNVGLDDNTLWHHKEVTSHVPEYFQNQTVPIVSYNYTNAIAPTIFNYKKALQKR